MLRQEVQIRNKLGLHARAAAKLVHLAARYQSSVKLTRDHQEVNGKSILGILLLAACQGATLGITCEGSDESEAMAALTKLIDDRFDEGA
jgi:phosphocarrier protein